MMRTITHTIARGLYSVENRAPRFKPFSQKIASFISSTVSRDLADLRQWSLLCSSARTGSVPGRKNCWEFTGCCEETHGRFANVLGVCPAALESRLDGIHGGRNGGRSCWVVSGTHCHGNVGKSSEQKKKTCSQCGFYRSVKWEESVSFIQSDDLLLKLLQ
jgi:hypothetical protein